MNPTFEKRHPRRPARLGLRLALLLAGACLALITAPALAHATLLRSEPAPGATVSEALRALQLTFDETLLPGSEVQLFGDGFQQIQGVTSTVDGPRLNATLASALAPGNYTVQWTALSPDGHSVQGTYQFAVAAGIGEGQGPRLTFFISLAIGLLAVVVIVALVWRGRRQRVL